MSDHDCPWRDIAAAQKVEIATLRDRLAAVEAEVEKWKARHHGLERTIQGLRLDLDGYDGWQSRAVKAEADNEWLRAALTTIQMYCASPVNTSGGGLTTGQHAAIRASVEAFADSVAALASVALEEP